MSGGVVICAVKLTIPASFATCKESTVVANINAFPSSLNVLVGPGHVPAKFMLSSVAIGIFITLRTYDLREVWREKWILCQ